MGASRVSEPRSMTTRDAVVLTVGAVVSLASLPSWLGMARGLPWLGLGLFLRNSAGFWVAAVSLGAVSLGRSIGYRRLPRPAEWLALGGLAWGLTLILPPAALEDFVQVVGRGVSVLSETEIAARWGTAVVGFAMVIAGVAAIRSAGPIVPVGWQTVWLVFLVFLAFWCPLALFADHAADWFAPGAGFGPGTIMIVYRGACQWFALLPTGLLVGLPVVATVGERLRGRRWSWLEWSAALTAGLAGLLASLVYRGEFRLATPGWYAERALALVWLTVVTLVDVAIVTRLQRPRPDRQRGRADGPDRLN